MIAFNTFRLPWRYFSTFLHATRYLYSCSTHQVRVGRGRAPYTPQLMLSESPGAADPGGAVTYGPAGIAIQWYIFSVTTKYFLTQSLSTYPLQWGSPPWRRFRRSGTRCWPRTWTRVTIIIIWGHVSSPALGTRATCSGLSPEHAAGLQRDGRQPDPRRGAGRLLRIARI